MNIKEYSSIVGFTLKSPVFTGIERISESVELDHGIAAYYLFTPLLIVTGLETGIHGTRGPSGSAERHCGRTGFIGFIFDQPSGSSLYNLCVFTCIIPRDRILV